MAETTRKEMKDDPYENATNTKHQILCEGQNHNIKMVAICMYVVTPSVFFLKVINNKFLVSGHSNLPCDRNFGTIEKRFVSEIYIIKMEKEDFTSTKNLESLIMNRKKGKKQ